MRVHRHVLVAMLATVSAATVAAAQEREPIGPFAADVRAALPRFKDDAQVAAGLAVDQGNLPTRGLGLAGGIHWYPLRMGKVTLGLGGEIIVSRGSKTLEPEVEGGVEGPTVKTRFSAFSPQLSLNFGSRRGWSYLSGGLGWAGLTSEREDAPFVDDAGRTKTINYGGGARWFAREHLAFALDLRFYRIDAQEAAVERPAYPGMTLMVFSAGVAFK